MFSVFSTNRSVFSLSVIPAIVIAGDGTYRSSVLLRMRMAKQRIVVNIAYLLLRASIHFDTGDTQRYGESLGEFEKKTRWEKGTRDSLHYAIRSQQLTGDGISPSWGLDNDSV